MLSGKEVISRLIIIDNSATIQAYLSLISRLLKMPKANKPNSGPYVYVANLKRLLTTLPSRLLKTITTIMSNRETPICTFLRKGFCAASGLFSMFKKSTEKEVVSEVKALSALL